MHSTVEERLAALEAENRWLKRSLEEAKEELGKNDATVASIKQGHIQAKTIAIMSVLTIGIVLGTSWSRLREAAIQQAKEAIPEGAVKNIEDANDKARKLLNEVKPLNKIRAAIDALSEKTKYITLHKDGTPDREIRVKGALVIQDDNKKHFVRIKSQGRGVIIARQFDEKKKDFVPATLELDAKRVEGF